jgi:hypothetical protein
VHDLVRVLTRQMTLAITQSIVALCSATVNALRCASTPRSAGPSGVDGACAQRTRQQLRDGRAHARLRYTFSEPR